MILAIDIGNTVLLVGVFDGNRLLCSEQLSTDSLRTAFEYARDFADILSLHGIRPESVNGAITASDVPLLTQVILDAVKKVSGVTSLVVGPGIRTGLRIMIDNPAELGSSLVVAAIAALEIENPPLIVIDMGTAITLSVIDDKRRYLGGAILPGIRASLTALTENASKLPDIQPIVPQRAIGKNTVSCMQSGVFFGTAAMLDGMIDRITKEIHACPTVLATGDYAGTLVSCCQSDIRVLPHLILDGLALLYIRNTTSNP